MDAQVVTSRSAERALRTNRCRLCGAAISHTFVDLGMSPLCENFLTHEQLDAAELYYPLRPLVCRECFLVQLNEYANPEQIFRGYVYFSSYSTTWVSHAKDYCDTISRRLELGTNSLVVELGSNDGYLLQHFLPRGIPVLGIEPAPNVANAAIRAGIPTRVAFFGLGLAEQLVTKGKQATLIVGNNVLAQVPDLNDFVSGMRRLLHPEGLITLEFPHLERLISENQFDTIYHEHFSYFSLLTVARLANNHRLKLVDVEELPTHGGSLRVYLAHAKSAWSQAPSVAKLLAHEREFGLCRLATYSSFADRVHRAKRALLSFLIAAKGAGKSVCGYGAPGKAATLLNYCGIGPDLLAFTVDRNPYKHGRFTAGMHIPIYPVEAINAAKPDYILILPWNLKHEIICQMRHVSDWGGKFVVPIPEVAVVDSMEVQS